MMQPQYLNKHDARTVSKSRAVITGKRKVAIDVRVSTEHEQQMNALDNQIQWAKELGADHKDWIFDVQKDLYIERGLSGTTMKKRPEFKKMIELAKTGKYDLIVVREVCRFMRNAKLTLNLVDELLQYGVEVYFVNDGIWSRNPDDYFKLTIMAQYAEQESRKTSERVFSGQAVARENGIIYGNGNILGYKLIVGEKSKDTHYVIDEEQAETVRKIYELALTIGVKKIRHYLEGSNPEHKIYKTAEGNTKWYDSTIERILRRSTYMGVIEHFQSVTENPLTHERKSVEKDKRVKYELGAKIPRIIEPEAWKKVQEELDKRALQFRKGADGNSHKVAGGPSNKNIYCRKMRCGCGRRFKFDEETDSARGTFRCYSLVDDGNRDIRAKKSEILNDNCSIDGIRDWKMDFISIEVFKHLEVNVDEIKMKLLLAIEEAFVANADSSCLSELDIIKYKSDIEKLNNKNNRLLDGFEEGVVSKEAYLERKQKNDAEINRIENLIINSEKKNTIESEKAKTLEVVKAFIDKALAFPKTNGYKMKVPEAFIEAYVNSIKACKGGVFEYNIRVNPEAEVQIPIKPDEEFNPQYDSANLFIDNSDATLICEFELSYEDAKNYASMTKGQFKVKRVHFEKPITVRVFANL